MSTSSDVNAATSLPGGTTYLFWAICRQNATVWAGSAAYKIEVAHVVRQSSFERPQAVADVETVIADRS
jgi:hypothetical protein